MADVLIGQAYYLRFDPKLWRAQQPFAPLGALYAASYLRSLGHSTALFDSMLAESELEWSAALERVRPRFAVLYEDNFNYLSKMCLLRMRDAAMVMIQAARDRGCQVIVSGSDATDHAEVYLRAGAAAVVLGEGEVTLAALITTLMGGGSPADVTGVAYLRSGIVERTAPRPIMREIDALPTPAWDLVDVDRYRQVWRARHGYYAMNIATTRGCPFHCNWCAKPIYGQRYTVRAASKVVDEMKWLKHTYAPDQLSFADDVFGLQPGWIQSFAEQVAQQNARIPFRSLMRADQINAGTIGPLAAAGCRMVWIGAESGSQRILDAMEKGVTVQQIRDAATLLQAAGIQVGMFLQFGYPGETWEDVEKTLQLVRDASPDDIGVSVSYPLPGTKFYERVRAELGRKQNWIDSDELAMMYRATYPPEFYRRLHHVVHHEFRARQLARRVNGLIRRPARLRLPDLRRIAAWAYHRVALPYASYELRRLTR